MALLALLMTLWLALPARAEDPDPPAEADPWAEIEDPRRLADLGRAALSEGDRDTARALFERSIERNEFSKYFAYRDELKEALLLERLGEHEASAAQYRAFFEADVLRTVQVLRIVSEHPEREALVQEAYDHVRGLVDTAKAGGKALIYRTKSGKERFLQPMTTRELLEAGGARYCFIEDLDFTTWEGPLPDSIRMNRCVVGRIFAPNLDFGKLAMMGFVIGDVDLGKTWEGKRNKSRTIPASRFGELTFRDTVFMGRANFWAVTVEGGRALFPLSVFEGEADFKGAEFWGDTDLRFASFGGGANFKKLRMHAPVYFGGTRYRADTVFTGVYSERDVYFNSAVFDGSVAFDDCEWQRSATFEDAHFLGPASFGSTRVAGNVNLSRAVFHGPVDIKEVQFGELDALGVHFKDTAYFMDASVRGRTRFSLDEVTRHAVREQIDGLLPLYRKYQGDEDADDPLTTKSSYGVTELDDLNTTIDGDISFANTVFGGYTVFEGVTFGGPDRSSTASFFNAQFLGETHFERTDWYAQADFSTIFGTEVAFNYAMFRHSLLLDDANVAGRVTLTDAVFLEDTDLSFYGAEISSFQIAPDQVSTGRRSHRLFYEHCAGGDVDRSDVRISRIDRGRGLDDRALREICASYVIDEFVALKDSYGERAMTSAEDSAYWWARHHQSVAHMRFGGLGTKIYAVVVEFLLFEVCFGWGVRLGNLGIAVVAVTVLFAWLYRRFCPNTILAYDGEDVAVKDVSFVGLCFVSLQSLIAINTGWDFGDDDHRFRWLNTIETLIGFLILTFFVGAYTRMILA